MPSARTAWMPAFHPLSGLFRVKAQAAEKSSITFQEQQQQQHVNPSKDTDEGPGLHWRRAKKQIKTKSNPALPHPTRRTVTTSCDRVE